MDYPTKPAAIYGMAQAKKPALYVKLIVRRVLSETAKAALMGYRLFIACKFCTRGATQDRFCKVFAGFIVD